MAAFYHCNYGHCGRVDSETSPPSSHGITDAILPLDPGVRCLHVGDIRKLGDIVTGALGTDVCPKLLF
jgi:hypothetical protein